MKKKNSFWIYLFMATGVFLITANNCKKDETSSKKDPVLTWENPEDITYGTLLSETQLNATADVPGALVYTPPIGTKLNEGDNQELKVDFTPTDVITYNTASKTVKINVKPGGAGSIIFNPGLTYGTVADFEGYNYKTIAIGSQIWMAENLRTTHYQNGNEIPEVTNITEWNSLISGAYCNYDNNPTIADIYGKLYNYYAIADSRNLCPSGWRVPTDAEWTILAAILDGEDWAGGAMKETGVTHWKAPNPGATNTSGFTGLPGGRILSGSFLHLGEEGYWWSSTIFESNNQVWYRALIYDNLAIRGFHCEMASGMYVRCIKD